MKTTNRFLNLCKTKQNLEIVQSRINLENKITQQTLGVV